MARKIKKTTEDDSHLKMGENKNSQSVGYTLKNTRIIKGLSLEDVSRSLCITKSFLVRLEEQCETLPVDVYTLGFIRAYSKFLDVDSDALVQQFKSSNNAATYEETLVFPKPLPRRGIPHIKVVSISLAFALLLTMGWETITRIGPLGTPSLDLKKMSLAENSMPLAPISLKEMESPKEEAGEIIKVAAIDSSSNNEPVEVTPMTEVTMVASEMMTPSEAVATPELTHPMAAGNFVEAPSAPDSTVTNAENEPIAQKVVFESNAQIHDASQAPTPDVSLTPAPDASPTLTVAIAFTDKTWVQVKDAQDQIVINRTFNIGDKYEFKETNGYVLKTGNAGGVRLIVNDEDMGTLGDAGQVMGNISLDPQNLLAQHPKTQ